MIPLYTEMEYKNSNSADLLPFKCEYCSIIFHKTKKLISKDINKAYAFKYCSRLCSNCSNYTGILLKCKRCSTEFIRIKSQTSINNFCSKSCAVTYNNKHKTTGTRRSKLEIYIESQLKNLYPNLDILFNDKTTINSELDIYIPSLKLAFELNGLFHYEPVFGQDKLDKIVNNDNRKFAACNENQISLCVIDTSQQKYFRELTGKKYLDVIVNLINSHLSLI